MLKIDGIVNSVFDSMTWLLSEKKSDQVWLVDCGDIDKILEKAGGREIAGVLLTHAHFDHIYGLPELLKYYPNCLIYTNESGIVTLANPKFNLSFYHELPISVEGGQIKICCEGDDILLFNSSIAKVYDTPGHHPSCITYLVGDTLFTGDAYIPGVKVVTNLPGADKRKAKESFDKIVSLAEGKMVYSGHFI